MDVPLKQVLDNQRVKDSYRSALLSDPFLCKTVPRKFCFLEQVLVDERLQENYRAAPPQLIAFFYNAV